MGDHDIMRGMAVDYRREAEVVADPARRHHLVGLAEYCQNMAAAMERLGKKGAALGGLRSQKNTVRVDTMKRSGSPSR